MSHVLVCCYSLGTAKGWEAVLLVLPAARCCNGYGGDQQPTCGSVAVSVGEGMPPDIPSLKEMATLPNVAAAPPWPWEQQGQQRSWLLNTCQQ